MNPNPNAARDVQKHFKMSSIPANFTIKKQISQSDYQMSALPVGFAAAPHQAFVLGAGMLLASVFFVFLLRTTLKVTW